MLPDLGHDDDLVSGKIELSDGFSENYFRLSIGIYLVPISNIVIRWDILTFAVSKVLIPASYLCHHRSDKQILQRQ